MYPQQQAPAPAYQTFTFHALPRSVNELAQLPGSDLRTPFQTAALTVLALCAYPTDPNASIAMLDYLRGPRPMSGYDKQFLRDRFAEKPYKALSYLAGTSPENGYTPSQPYAVTIIQTPISFQQPNYAKLFVRSSGADSPREICLRLDKTGCWRLWEQLLLVDIRPPASQDLWA